MLEVPGDIHVRSSLCSGIVANLPQVVVFGCSTSGLDSVQVTPTSQSLTVGQTAQFTAVGTYGNAKHATTETLTNSVTWNSSAPSVATVSASGVATAVGPGTTTITAGGSAYNGPTSASATLTVTGSAGGTAGGSIVSISVIPGSQSVASPSQTSQFIAIGTTSSGATQNLTNLVAWSSSSTQIATVGATTGLATGVGQGTATIAALYTNSKGGTAVTGTATFTVVGGKAEQFTAVAITPSSQSLSASGQTTQLIALGTSGSTGLQTDVTSSTQIKWSSSSPSIASVSASGLVTGASAGQRHHHGGVNECRRQCGVRYRNRRGLQYTRAGASAFAHDHSELDYRRQFTGYREFPGDRNVLGGSIRKRSDELRDLALFGARRFPGQLE